MHMLFVGSNMCFHYCHLSISVFFLIQIFIHNYPFPVFLWRWLAITLPRILIAHIYFIRNPKSVNNTSLASNRLSTTHTCIRTSTWPVSRCFECFFFHSLLWDRVMMCWRVIGRTWWNSRRAPRRAIASLVWFRFSRETRICIAS